MAQVICGCGRTHKVIEAGKTVERPNTVHVPSELVRAIRVGGKSGQTIRPSVTVKCGECCWDEQKATRVTHKKDSTVASRAFEKRVRRNLRLLAKIKARLEAKAVAKAA
jgi:DNA/RNA endonuclease G (NUC1)